MTYIKKIEEFAETQFLNDEHDGIGFICFGQNIIDPWMDNSARFPLSTQQAFELYGARNVLGFIEAASEKLGLNEQSFPSEGYPLETLHDSDTGYLIRIWKHGEDDYAVWYESCDISVRGSMESIVKELHDYFPGKGGRHISWGQEFLTDHADGYITKNISHDGKCPCCGRDIMNIRGEAYCPVCYLTNRKASGNTLSEQEQEFVLTLMIDQWLENGG